MIYCEKVLNITLLILYITSQGSTCKARASHGKKISDYDQFKILFVSQNKNKNHLIFKIHRDLH